MTDIQLTAKTPAWKDETDPLGPPADPDTATPLDAAAMVDLEDRINTALAGVQDASMPADTTVIIDSATTPITADSTGITDGQVLAYDSDSGELVPVDQTGGSGSGTVDTITAADDTITVDSTDAANPTIAVTADTFALAADVGADSGIATLDDTGSVPLAQLGNVPAGSITKAGVIATGVKATDLDGAADTDLTAEVSRAEAAEALLAPKASPALTGSPTAPTQTAADNSTNVATTAYVNGAVSTETTARTTADALLAPKASPTFTGDAKAKTQDAADDSTNIATTEYSDRAASNAVAAPEDVNAIGNSSTAKTLQTGLNTITLTAACTLTAPTAAAGASLAVALTQDGTGGRVVTWDDAILWPAGTAPTFTADAAAVDVVSLICFDGTHWLGFVGGLAFS